jgi:tRNA(fMet)-specific endonuclease VapC
MKHQPEKVSQRFAACYVGDVVMSAITFAELEFGALACGDPEAAHQNLRALIKLIEVRPFNIDAARAYAPIHQATRQKKSDYLNKLIAAHALALNTTLVTTHERDFAAYPTLIIENWLH